MYNYLTFNEKLAYFPFSIFRSPISPYWGLCSLDTIKRYLGALRDRMATWCEAGSPVSGEVEVDESYFGARHINGIEGFWGFAKSRPGKFRGMSKHAFYLQLKACEFRFNHRHDSIYCILLTLRLEKPLKLS